MAAILNNIAVKLLSLPVHFYRRAISPLLRPSCRHVPSCSQYALDALRIHGPLTGLLMATGRILRCRPGGTHGYDPVPRFRFKKYRPLSLYRKCNRLKH
ncbi:MAG: membrane protein insertion efficiency factor YidD [Bacteroidales bacterium]|nr:membrane protein insertion efficiency factor YidD [Bacteroidales bacterium]MDI9552334.1 membrane protein insertion efficiency factor YidD [Bacteroidota bacterium]NLK54645.1 membrane protein insertion efficiency factor YidD [Bacteroidales bacterium]